MNFIVSWTERCGPSSSWCSSSSTASASNWFVLALPSNSYSLAKLSCCLDCFGFAGLAWLNLFVPCSAFRIASSSSGFAAVAAADLGLTKLKPCNFISNFVVDSLACQENQTLGPFLSISSPATQS